MMSKRFAKQEDDPWVRPDAAREMHDWAEQEAARIVKAERKINMSDDEIRRCITSLNLFGYESIMNDVKSMLSVDSTKEQKMYALNNIVPLLSHFRYRYSAMNDCKGLFENIWEQTANSHNHFKIAEKVAEYGDKIDEWVAKVENDYTELVDDAGFKQDLVAFRDKLKLLNAYNTDTVLAWDLDGGLGVPDEYEHEVSEWFLEDLAKEGVSPEEIGKLKKRL